MMNDHTGRTPTELLADIKASAVATSARVSIFSQKYKKPVILAFLLAFFNQLSGINFILYYAPQILEVAGLGSRESLENSIFIGVFNFLFTMIGVYLIDKVGRKRLMFVGSVGYIISLSMVSWSFYANMSPTFLMVFLLMFIASHAVGQGAVIWVYISEIFPNVVRASGQSFGSGTHWVFAALITLFAPAVISAFEGQPYPIFAFLAGTMVLQLLYVIFMMFETKGKSLEEMEAK